MDAKTAVDRVGAGKKRDVNARFLAMTSHYVFEANFCNPAAGWEKGQVEKNVRDARHRLWQVMPAFPDLAALNNWLEERCKVLWAETAHGRLPPLTHALHVLPATGRRLQSNLPRGGGLRADVQR
jgi:transposase